ncbi:protein-lysine methyltransferase METTL21D [Aplysia californica]|uniref:Protein-lysine methyltransferase METTL21D n=1 Tax=Aplysia californica TaxID=6500 RepID=A0ABM0JI28_APLCA|nr:protein-lysine methyltransferase METTL21D [Aplysia californica]
MAVTNAVDLSKLYTRNFELNDETELVFHQSEIGDVGCVVWDAALVLCKYLETRDFDEGNAWHGKTVIDLGSGTGAVGLVAAALGALTVVTDLPEFVPLMDHNVNYNKSVIAAGSCSAQPLVWGDSSQTQNLKEKFFPQGLDFVTIADCVYYEESITSLVETIVELCSDKTTVLCCYEERDIGNKSEMQRKFFEMIGKRFDVSEVPLAAQDPHFRSPDIHIMKFTPKLCVVR